MGGLDELLTAATEFPFPRAVHLRNRRDREPTSSDSEDEDDSMTKDGSLNSGERENGDCDSIASDDFDEDGEYKYPPNIHFVCFLSKKQKQKQNIFKKMLLLFDSINCSLFCKKAI